MTRVGPQAGQGSAQSLCWGVTALWAVACFRESFRGWRGRGLRCLFRVTPSEGRAPGPEAVGQVGNDPVSQFPLLRLLGSKGVIQMGLAPRPPHQGSPTFCLP